jgi:hypothetical protein
MILSIDVGIKNLAMCLLDEESDNHIVEWDVSGVPPEHSDGLFPCLRRHLDAKPWTLDATTVLIEKQPGMNKKMKTVENFIHAYFVIKNPDVETIIYDARHKVPDVAGAGKTKYRQRKQTGITRCKEFLDVNEVNKEWREHFKKSKKKDDLADTVLQALSYTMRVVPLPKIKEKQKETIKSRKPTENQKATKYSKSNLAWMVKNHTQDELEKNKRFQKDLRRYYTDMEEFKTLL